MGKNSKFYFLFNIEKIFFKNLAEIYFVAIKTQFRRSWRLINFILHFFLLISFGCLTQTTSSEINGGSTSYTDRDYAPLEPYFNYNYTQILYTASELSIAGLTAGASISKIQFYYSVDAGDETKFDDWVIYMGNTSKSSFAGTNASEWISTSNMTQVFNSVVTFPAAGNWMTVNLSTNFTWDGLSNLVISVDENSSGYGSNVNCWKSTDPAGSNYEVLQHTSDLTNCNPSSPVDASYRWSSRPILKLVYSNCASLTSPGTISGNQTLCIGGNPVAFSSTAAASGGSGGTIQYQWESSISSSSSGYSDIVGATSATYDPPSGITVTTYYRRKSKRCSSSWEQTTSFITVTVNSKPPTPTGVSASRCGTGTVELGVTASINGTIKWYTTSDLTTMAPNGSVSACTSPNPCTTYWTTPSISTTTTYYATRTNLNGCESDAVQVIATVITAGPTGVSAGQDVDICIGNSSQLNGSATGALMTDELFNENFDACSGLLNPSICNWKYGVFSVADSYTFWKISSSCAVSGNAMTLHDDWDGNDCDYDESGVILDPSIDFITYPQNPINAMGYSNLNLKFDWKCIGEAGYDYGRVMYSFDGDLWYYANSKIYVSQSSWITENITLPSNLNNTSFFIGFEWINDDTGGGGIGKAFSIDNIQITGERYEPVLFSWSTGTGLSSSSISNPVASPSTTTTYTLTATSNGCSVTDDVVVTVNKPSIPYSIAGKAYYIWRGTSSSDYQTQTNWYYKGTNDIWSIASAAPSTGSVVVIASGICVNNAPIINSSSSTADSLIILSGANLTVTGSNTRFTVENDLVARTGASLTLESSGTLEVRGGSLKFKSGSTFTPNNGTVEMHYKSGHIDAHVIECADAGNNSFYNLNFHGDQIQAGDTAVALSSNITVTNELKVVSANLRLNGKTLTLGPDATLVEGSNGKKVFDYGADGKIVTTRTVGNGGTSDFGGLGLTVTLPSGKQMGPTTVERYSRKNTMVSVPGDEGLDENGNQPIERFFRVTPTFNGTAQAPLNATVVFNFKTAGLGTYNNGDVSLFALYRRASDDNAWEKLNGIISTTNKTITVPNFPRFSDVTLGGGGEPLPVELVSFSGACEDKVIDLTWQTASEFNSSYFDVEKSRDGENWQVLSTIQSAGTSNELITYQYTDQYGTDGNNYFRLRQVDIDGKEKLYNPINISCQTNDHSYFSSYPNPSGSSFQVIVNNKDLLGSCVLNIVDAAGKVIEQKEINVQDGLNMFVINQELTPGIYFLNISNGSKSTPVLRHAIK